MALMLSSVAGRVSVAACERVSHLVPRSGRFCLELLPYEVLDAEARAGDGIPPHF